MLPCKSHSETFVPILTVGTISYSLQRVLWENGLMSWMKFSSRINLRIVCTPSTDSGTMGACSKARNKFLIALRELSDSTNTSKEEDESQMLLKRKCWGINSRYRYHQLHKTQTLKGKNTTPRLLKRILFIFKGKHRFDCLIMVTCFSENFGNSEGKFSSFWINTSNCLHVSNLKTKRFVWKLTNWRFCTMLKFSNRNSFSRNSALYFIMDKFQRCLYNTLTETKFALDSM